jgi:hypothetical protein
MLDWPCQQLLFDSRIWALLGRGVCQDPDGFMIEIRSDPGSQDFSVV